MGPEGQQRPARTAAGAGQPVAPTATAAGKGKGDKGTAAGGKAGGEGTAAARGKGGKGRKGRKEKTPIGSPTTRSGEGQPVAPKEPGQPVAPTVSLASERRKLAEKGGAGQPGMDPSGVRKAWQPMASQFFRYDEDAYMPRLDIFTDIPEAWTRWMEDWPIAPGTAWKQPGQVVKRSESQYDLHLQSCAASGAPSVKKALKAHPWVIGKTVVDIKPKLNAADQTMEFEQKLCDF